MTKSSWNKIWSLNIVENILINYYPAAKKIEAVMTPDEKAKLYRAIDYQENTTPAIYPPHFIENVFSFKLRTLEVEVRDSDGKIQTILSSSLREVTAQVEQRMSGQALK